MDAHTIMVLAAFIILGAVAIVLAVANVALIYLHVYRSRPQVKPDATTASVQSPKIAFHAGLPGMPREVKAK
jgi:hypothetical protein